MKEKYIPGECCQCSARCSCECGCDVDWTLREVYELREQVKHLQSKIEGMGYRHSHLRCQIIQAENVTWLVKSRLQSEREQRDRLAAVLQRIRDGYGGQVASPNCCEDCDYLLPIDEALQSLTPNEL